MYLVNNGRTIVQVGQNGVNMDDLLTVRPNGVIRTKGNPAETVMPMPTTWVGDKALAISQDVHNRREETTGVTRLSMGIDADTLHDTATGFKGLQEAADDRVEMVARMFAAALGQMYEGVLDLVMHHQDRPRQIRVSGKPIEIDPALWHEHYGVRVNVALGDTQREQQVAGLLKVLELQGQAMQMGLATPNHLYNTFDDLVQKVGLKKCDRYFLDPDSDEYKQMQMQRANQPQQPDPYVQAEMIKANGKQQEAMMRARLQQQKQQHEQAMAEIDKQLEQRADDQRFLHDMTELELKYNTNVPGSAV